MSNLSYWQRRAIEHEQLVHQGLNRHHPVIARAYNRAQSYLTRRVIEIYERYLMSTDLTQDEVDRILNSRTSPQDIAELRRLAANIEDREIRRQAQNYLNVLAAKHRITRLESLKAKAYLVARQVADVELRFGTNYLIDVIQESHRQAAAEAIIRRTEDVLNVYDEGNFPRFSNRNGRDHIEIVNPNNEQVMRIINLERETEIPRFKELNTRRIRQILNINWVADGNFSSRVWNNTAILGERLQELFTVEAMTGMRESEMAREIAREFEIGQNVAKRLIRTESNFVATNAKKASWEEHGVKEFIVIAVLDLKTSKVCQSMDGKIFPVSEMTSGINAPPFHPFVGPQ